MRAAEMTDEQKPHNRLSVSQAPRWVQDVSPEQAYLAGYDDGIDSIEEQLETLQREHRNAVDRMNAANVIRERTQEQYEGVKRERDGLTGRNQFLSTEVLRLDILVRSTQEQLESLRRIEQAAREFLTACDEYGCSGAPLDQYATLVEAVSGLPDGRESYPASDPREQVETFEDGSPLIVGPNHLASNQESEPGAPTGMGATPVQNTDTGQSQESKP